MIMEQQLKEEKEEADAEADKLEGGDDSNEDDSDGEREI